MYPTRKTLLIATMLTAAFILPFGSSAEAKSHRHHHTQHSTSYHRTHHSSHMRVRYPAYGEEGRIVSHPIGCPRTLFCGCGVSVRVFGHPVRGLFAASRWDQFPPAAAGPGMVAVRAHHVMYIEHLDGNGNAVVYDPNSGGHATRIHTRSLAGYHIVNPFGGSRYSMRG